MRILSMLFGLLRSIGRFTPNPDFPLISSVYPPPFSVPLTTTTENGGRGPEAPYKTPILSTDAANWFWNDNPTDRVDLKAGKKVYSRHGSSFLVTHTTDDVNSVGKLMLNEMKKLVEQVEICHNILRLSTACLVKTSSRSKSPYQTEFVCLRCSFNERSTFAPFCL